MQTADNATNGDATKSKKTTHVDPEEIIQKLSQVDLLRALPPEEVQAIVPYIASCHFDAGALIFAQGDTGDALYVVDRGTVTVLLDGQTELGEKGPGEAFGEMALLTGEARNATVIAKTELDLWEIRLKDFQKVISSSPALEAALRELSQHHRRGLEIARAARYSPRTWQGRAIRSLVARQRGLQTWQIVMGFGLLLWVVLFLNKLSGWLTDPSLEIGIMVMQLIAGLTILQGACEAFILAVDRAGKRFLWDGFISGTIGSLVATLPEFVVITFLVQVQPLAAFVAAVVTIFNNALGFSLYSFFLPKDQKGTFIMPPSLHKAGGEVLIAGSGIALVVGTVMLLLRTETHKTTLAGLDLVVVGVALIVIYGYYTYTLLRYYSQGNEEDHPAHPPDPSDLGHDSSWKAIISMFMLGIIGAYFGGDSIGGFADAALNRLGLPTILTASGLAFFAGISEYIIVWKAHRRGELGIALSNVFGGMTQVMFLLVPFCMIVIAVYGWFTGSPEYAIPINMGTTMLMLLLFPLFYVLLQYLEEDHTLSNLDAAAMTGIYALLLYFLFTVPAA